MCRQRIRVSIFFQCRSEHVYWNIDRRRNPSQDESNLLRPGLDKIRSLELQRTRSVDVQGTRNELINE